MIRRLEKVVIEYHLKRAIRKVIFNKHPMGLMSIRKPCKRPMGRVISIGRRIGHHNPSTKRRRSIASTLSTSTII
jgi:hypothetical protein